MNIGKLLNKYLNDNIEKFMLSTEYDRIKLLGLEKIDIEFTLNDDDFFSNYGIKRIVIRGYNLEEKSIKELDNYSFIDIYSDIKILRISDNITTSVLRYLSILDCRLYIESLDYKLQQFEYFYICGSLTEIIFQVRLDNYDCSRFCLDALPIKELKEYQDIVMHGIKNYISRGNYKSLISYLNYCRDINVFDKTNFNLTIISYVTSLEEIINYFYKESINLKNIDLIFCSSESLIQSYVDNGNIEKIFRNVYFKNLIKKDFMVDKNKLENLDVVKENGKIRIKSVKS